jgi:hypothetical protein
MYSILKGFFGKEPQKSLELFFCKNQFKRASSSLPFSKKSESKYGEKDNHRTKE